MSTNFAGQWLYLRNLEAIEPESFLFPDFDDSLRQAMRRETELFFDSILRENRSVLDLLTADYTFVNERLARHYGIPNVYGSRFRRVTVADENRRGLLGQASILFATSRPNRTSPVLRGKWILQNIFGVTPPDPPPNIPAFEEKSNVTQAVSSVRERLARAPRESGVRDVPLDDRSARVCARELRCDRPLARRRRVIAGGGHVGNAP